LARAPRLLVQWEQSPLPWWDSLKTLYKTPRLKSSRRSPAGRLRGPSQWLSLAFHLALIVFLVYLPAASRAREAMEDRGPTDSEKIYYRLTALDPARKLHRIAPAGAGARPGKGDLVERSPALGATVRQRNLEVVSRPVRPDNKRQTIFQPAVPPDLRMKTELKLPNIIEAKPVVVPKPELNFNHKDSKPTVPNRRDVTVAAPVLKVTSTSTPLTDLTDPTNLQPKMPVPEPSAAASPPTTAQANTPPVPNSGPEVQGAGTGLVVISTDPGQASDMVALPAGNRFADFSISPVGSGPGSPGGSSHETSGVGTGGGAGGDSSTGVGAGETGGGGGKLGGAGSLSVNGTAGSGGATAGVLGPGVPLSMVYPISKFSPYKASLVVSAGPMGGGGLGIYGALHCGKIYTVFLPMPGKAWTLQYCEAGAGARAQEQTNAAVVHMEQGITPPTAEDRFDFKRLPLPEDKVHKQIVLKGLLREDGTVEGLEVRQGLLPMMDEAARLAFSNWKFRPASRGGKAIAVAILVGIPSDPPPARAAN
jgi:Gram-negative bacterial TonB protein C-terminal